MKKLLLFAALYLLVNVAGAQYFGLGAKAGMNASHFTGRSQGQQTLYSFHAGSMAYFGINRHWGIQPEFLYSLQGGRLLVNNYRLNVKLNYYTMPVLLKYSTTSGFYAELGPQLMASSSQSINGQKVPFYARNVDFSADAGVGYRWPSGVGVGMRYVAGLSRTSIYYEDVRLPDFKTNAIQVSLFWMPILDGN